MKFAVTVFPGSNCDHDCEHVLKNVLKQKTEMVWHQQASLPSGTDCVVVPGGFSYGDYLRCGAIARFSPVMKAVVAHAKKGGLVLGICNGFQILTEAGLVPGSLLRNKSLRFLCQPVNLRVENDRTNFTNQTTQGQVVNIPIAHGEGNYFCDPATLASLKDHGQIVFRYCEADGSLSEASNPNGSLEAIAGVTNREGNVLGMMPHPERVAEAVLGGTDGLLLFQSILNSMATA
jgi:phosphoribosylformylglycinamidine synthase